MNSINITGRIATELTIYEKVVRFNVAVKKPFKTEGQPDADFFRCKAFGKTKEFIENWMDKGVKVEITGRLENERATSVIDGKAQYRDAIVIERIEFAESKKKAEESAPSTSGFNNADAEADGLPFN